ncbi:MAG: extracellular solute-binding protein [Bacillus sp. (in: Bacteria)]|nr:extracellular solute-binding protein [Bacillus sp. (in: firmicutes)]MCM1426310.1 extracellular solute-binding protein [Eubacterium sp.]
MKKKIISLLMVAVMTASLVGCGNSGGGSSDSTDNSAATTDNSAASTDNNTAAADTQTTESAADAASDVEKPEEITIMVDGTVFTKENGRDEFMAKLEELIGVKINVIQPDHDAYYDNVGQTIASGDWPDVIILSATYYSAYASEGVLWDMTDVYEASDLKVRQDAANSTSVIDGVKLDGRLYGMPATRGNGCVTYVKKKWMDNCGITSVPTNYDEYLAMLEAFTNGDPDGDGTDGNTFGVTAAGFVGPEAPYVNYLPEFYQDATPSFYQKADGSWADGFTEDSMKAALERLADAYAKGVIDPTTLTNGTADCRNKFYSDDFGAFTYWAGTWATNLKTNLENNGLDGELVALPPIAEVGTYLDRVPVVWAITSQCENPEGVFKYFFETMQDGGEVQFLWTYGVEGVHWSTAAETLYAGETNDKGESKEKVYAEGEFHMLDNLENPGTQYTKAHIDPKLALVTLADDPSALEGEAKASAELFATSSRAADLVPSTDAMTEYNGDLTTKKNELISKVAMGEMTIEDAYAEFESSGAAGWSQQIVDSLNQ